MFFKKYKKLKWLAYHDSLTGLLNRNWLYENMHTIKQGYVYFIDINDLKEVNKKGHTYGDQYIIDVINEISSYIDSKNDIFIRYAGDEFILFTDSVQLNTCKLYSVGEAEVSPGHTIFGNLGIRNAINFADSNMIINKEKFKK